MKTVSLREANQDLSRLVRELEDSGEDVLITRRGTPVARLVRHRPDRAADPEWQAAYARMEALLKKGFHLGGEGVDRDALHDR
ncbi:MAG: type II toxin-antitoxin system Phd/YefM family antitoxin [Sphingomonadales bacterium]|nr:type II toxin-antitoxin system Phd/YefM family antitoxin [Sphingomonadales bacterium]